MNTRPITAIFNSTLVATGIAVLIQSVVACGSPAAPVRAAAQAGQPTPKDLDGLLAPIALYPDPLLAQMLMAATDPASVTKLNAWLKANAKLKGSDLQDEAIVAGFEPQFVALAVFPQVVATMAERIDWTTLVGQLFTADRSAVFASIQKLRTQAKEVGTLKSTPQQQVKTQTTSSGEQVIVVEPTNPQVVYVPQYNPTVVYTQAPPATTTVVVQDNNTDAVVAAGLIGFTAGIAIGAAVNNNHYYGPYGWYGGAYMYNDAWDDYYDAREDAREDWTDHREDMVEERSDRRENTQEQRTDRQQNRQENRPESTAEAQQRRSDAQAQAQQKRTDTQGQAQQRQAQGQTASTQTRSAGAGNYEARGYGSGSGQATTQRSGGASSDAFSGYSSGKSERAASSRGQQSRSSSRGGGARSGGGRRR